MSKNKKAVLDLTMRWPEYFFIVLFVAGFLLIFLARNEIFAYIYIFLGGMMIGRYLYGKKSKYPAPFYIMTRGFVAGLVVALIITDRADWKIGLLIFIFSNMFSYWLSEKGFITDN